MWFLGHAGVTLPVFKIPASQMRCFRLDIVATDAAGKRPDELKMFIIFYARMLHHIRISARFVASNELCS